MIPVHQLIFMDDVAPGTADEAVEAGRPAGDCMRAAVASIFERPLDEVPHFVQYRSGDRLLWWWALVGWCFAEHRVHVTYIEEAPPPGYSVACGKSPRGHGHCCVALDGEIIHDPHQSGDGLVAVEHYFAMHPDAAHELTREAEALGMYEEETHQ